MSIASVRMVLMLFQSVNEYMPLLRLMENFLIGGVASVFGCIFLQPLDLIKTRLQENSNRPSTRGFYVPIEIIRSEGMRSLWHGTCN